MKNDSIDPRVEKLVALLYGELPELEAQALRREIDADPALAAEWKELSEARSFLGAWEMPEESPGFVFVNEPEVAARRTAGFRSRLRGLFPVWSWGLAAAATAVLVLAINGFRVEKLDNGLAFRFGHEKTETTQVASNLSPDGVRGVPLGSPSALPVSNDPAAAQPVAAQPVTAAPADGASPYLTKQEFQAYAAGMTQTMAALLNEYGRQRDADVAAAMQLVLKNVTDKQTEDYRDLRGRFDALATGLGQEQLNTRNQLGYLLGQVRSTSPGSVHPSPAIETKGDQR